MNEDLNIDELVAEHEKDPAMKLALMEARRRLAPLLRDIVPQETYDRLMRGEGPASHVEGK